MASCSSSSLSSGPISTYSQVESSIYLSTPLGKLVNGSEVRKIQATQKGPTCWFYALKLISNLFQSSEKAPARTCISNIRKRDTAFHKKEACILISLGTYVCQFNRNPLVKQLFMEELTFENIISFGSNACDTRENINRVYQKRAHLIESSCYGPIKDLIQQFREQEQSNNIREFIVDNIKNEWLCNTIEDLKQLDPALPIDDIARYKALYEITTPSSWEEASFLDKLHMVQGLRLLRICRQLQLKAISWTKEDPIDALLETLRNSGPLYFSGFFQPETYDREPEELNEKPFGAERVVFGFKGTTRKCLNYGHAIIVVGAYKLKIPINGKTGYIYYVDPEDPSDPDQPTLQRIFKISYRTFVVNAYSIANKFLDGNCNLPEDSEYQEKTNNNYTFGLSGNRTDWMQVSSA